MHACWIARARSDAAHLIMSKAALIEFCNHVVPVGRGHAHHSNGMRVGLPTQGGSLRRPRAASAGRDPLSRGRADLNVKMHSSLATTRESVQRVLFGRKSQQLFQYPRSIFSDARMLVLTRHPQTQTLDGRRRLLRQPKVHIHVFIIATRGNGHLHAKSQNECFTLNPSLDGGTSINPPLP